MIDEKAPKFGLPKSLLIPIAAKNEESMTLFAGEILKRRTGRANRLNAVLIRSNPAEQDKTKVPPIWAASNSEECKSRLHPDLQVWVHVDFDDYRKAYVDFGMPAIPEGYFLDHVQNREAIRLREYSHPYLRLCPVSRTVNTNAGGNTGGEGMEKEFLRSMKKKSPEHQTKFREKLKHHIVYADPMDLTKMLNVAPGTQVLNGVRDTMTLFYPK